MVSTARSIASSADPGQCEGRSARWLPADGWIIGPLEDFLLFLGTPLLLLLVFGVAERTWSVAALSIFATVLAMGHYLPGLMRAYGDPSLFRRFPWRFTLAPLVLISTALVMASRDSQAFLLVVVVWGAWHWLMQTYGLVRIYDAKAKNFDPLSAWLDYGLCILWFGVLYWRTDGASAVLSRYYRAGGTLSPGLVRGLAMTWLALTAVVTFAYVVHVIRRARSGCYPSPLKIALLLVSFFFYLYAFGYSSSKLVAFGLFEGYHDIQYLAIVWVFNRNRAAKDPNAGSFTRFLFRQRAPLVLLYVLLCLGFGSYDFFARSVSDQTLARLALGLITGFALVHFYFDGFIWRMREPETRATLGVEPSGGSAGYRGLFARLGLSPRWRHALLWVVFSLPVMGLGIWESNGGRADGITACRQVLQVRPDSHKAHYLLANELSDQGAIAEALVHARRARELRPGYDLYEMLYADLVLRQSEQLEPSQLDELIACYESAARTRASVAGLHRNWAKALQLRRRSGESLAHYETAIQLDPTDVRSYLESAKLLAQKGHFSGAVGHLVRALQIDPENKPVRELLVPLLMSLGREREAWEQLRWLLNVSPQDPRLLVNAASILANSRDPRIQNKAEARKLAEEARRLAGDRSSLWKELAVILATLGDADSARNAARTAARLYRDQGKSADAEKMEAIVHGLAADASAR